MEYFIDDPELAKEFGISPDTLILLYDWMMTTWDGKKPIEQRSFIIFGDEEKYRDVAIKDGCIVEKEAKDGEVGGDDLGLFFFTRKGLEILTKFSENKEYF